MTRAVKSTRRLKGKSDPLDAYRAARTALAGDGLATPKDDATSGLRALHIARRSAVKHRTAVINQIKAMLVSAPDAVREKYRGLTTLRTDRRDRPLPTRDTGRSVGTVGAYRGQDARPTGAVPRSPKPRPSKPRSMRSCLKPTRGCGPPTVSVQTPRPSC